jgi:hypothetical protein
MDRLEKFLEAVRQSGRATGRLRGLLYILVGMKVRMKDGTEVSSGLTWRAAATALKNARWEREAAAELGIDPAELAPRDREKFWFGAISRAGLHTPEAKQDADALARALKTLGYEVSTGSE